MTAALALAAITVSTGEAQAASHHSTKGKPGIGMKHKHNKRTAAANQVADRLPASAIEHQATLQYKHQAALPVWNGGKVEVTEVRTTGGSAYKQENGGTAYPGNGQEKVVTMIDNPFVLSDRNPEADTAWNQMSYIAFGYFAKDPITGETEVKIVKAGPNTRMITELGVTQPFDFNSFSEVTFGLDEQGKVDPSAPQLVGSGQQSPTALRTADDSAPMAVAHAHRVA